MALNFLRDQQKNITISAILFAIVIIFTALLATWIQNATATEWIKWILLFIAPLGMAIFVLPALALSYDKAWS